MMEKRLNRAHGHCYGIAISKQVTSWHDGHRATSNEIRSIRKVGQRMKINRNFLVTCAVGLIVTGCGVPAIIENTVEADGYKITVSIQEPNVQKGRVNPIANMMLVGGRGPITNRKPAFLKAAELRSGCIAREETFLFVGEVFLMAAVDLKC